MLYSDMNEVLMTGLECAKQDLAVLSPSMQSFFGLSHCIMLLRGWHLEARDVRQYLGPLRFGSLSFSEFAEVVQPQ